MSNLTPISSAVPALSEAPLDTASATTYTDINGLAALKNNPTSPQAISAVAQQVEALFLQMMLKSMRDASAAVENDSNEMGMYQDMFDKQVALSISQHSDLGIARILKRQLSGKPAPAAAKPASTTPIASLTQTPGEFVNRVMPAISRASAKLGLNPMALLAQTALETGWGRRMPRNADGSSSYNLFGIKATDAWTGGRAIADSMEVSNGVAALKRTAFRTYGSIEDSVNDFAELLKNSPRYREAVAAGGDAQRYCEAIGKSGYASDPEYADKLNQILNGGALQAAMVTRVAKL